ncbi:sulfurtransferase [Aureimonas glaciei]|uniref:Sulfurtransferase n=1 Tax=Aureimonas glaciei TaxID=1776957 RepID=A0A917DB82_9HYPH|nr:rhodanese-like domain-containing protein [Aureimonas glaciei]GGD21732.1 sulfurtransferase [Aureimonas glaciei]
MTLLQNAAELVARPAEPGCVLIDTRPHADYLAGTIPGAISLNVYDFFIAQSDEAGIAAMATAVAAACAQAGIDRASKVVFFEEETGMRSPRGLWMHELLGHSTGAILDGGFMAWKAQGGAVQPGASPEIVVAPARGGHRSVAFRRDLVASTEEVLGRDPAACDLLDVRRRSEFDGSFVHDCCARPGRIPDAKFLFYEDFLIDGHYRGPADIADRAAAAGLSPERTVITYCHRGARAATALYGLRLAGFCRLQIFVGSWHEWAGDPRLPVAAGV